jgi:hypothetical protein
MAPRNGNGKNVRNPASPKKWKWKKRKKSSITSIQKAD